MKRTQARELLMQLLFQMSIHNDYSQEMAEKYQKEYPLEDQKEYFEFLIQSFIENKENVDKCIEKSAKHWKLDRISKVELAIIRLATTELLYMEEIPESVSINEAVELSKKFAAEESGKFVNGILGKVLRGKDEG